MIRTLSAIVFAAGLLPGCDGEERPTPTPDTESAGQTAAPEPTTAAPEEVPPSAAELPIPEDFEDEAIGDIAEANYRAALDRIAAEIAAEAP